MGRNAEIVKEMYRELLLNSDLTALYRWHDAGFKLHVFDEKFFSLNDYYEFCKKILEDTANNTLEFHEETFLETENRFAGHITFCINHITKGPILNSRTCCFYWFKKGKISLGRAISCSNWQTLPFFLECIADVLNEFEYEIN